MSRILSAIAVPGVGVVAYRSIPVVWALHPFDAVVICAALMHICVHYLYEAVTGKEL